MSIVYRGRDRDRFDDSRTNVSARTAGGTKVTRYVVKEEDDSRSDYQQARSRYNGQSRYDDNRSYAASRYDDRRTDYDRGNNRVEETKIILKRDDDDQYDRGYGRQEQDQVKNRETITIRRDSSPDRRDEYWRRPPGEPVEDRELVIRRTVERDNAPRERDLQVSKIDDDRRYSDYEMVSPQRPQFDDREREVQRYIRTSEYYQPQPAQQPQTIIIRQEPIIIRERVSERPREEDYQLVKKSDFDDQRSVSRRSDRKSDRGDPRDEEYFYEKKVRERIPEDDRGERNRFRREVSPHDSVSQVGRRNRGYSSDDSMVYVRKETRDGYDSDGSDHRGRDLAAGALAGIGAAELIRKHNNKEGKEVSHGVGRGARDVGAGIVGAVAAEGIRRWRSKSRGRDRSGSRGGKSRRGSSSSDDDHPKLKTLGGLGLAAAAVAAGALIAGRNKNNGSPDRRSRSRTRRSSRSRSRATSRSSLENDPTADDDRNPKTRNQRTAAAGAVGAAAMALYERHRSKSRGRESSHSPDIKDRLKQGAPIAGAGLAAAGLAHLYEKRKARDEADEIIKEERRSRSRGSRSRSRAPSTYYDGPPRSAYDPNLIQYGNDPLQGNNYGEGYYGRPGVEQDYYNNNNRDMVPAPAPPPATSSFDATNRSSRRRSLSSSPSRSRSRSRGAAAAAAAVGAGVAASELQNRSRERKERKRRSRDRRRSQQDPYTDDRSRQGSYAPYSAGRDPYEDANWHATHSGSYSQGMNDPYAAQTGFYPQGGQTPPPPGSMPQQGYGHQQPPQGQYGPQDFPPPPAGFPQGQQYQDPYGPGQNPYAPRQRGTDENVSDAPFPAPTDQHHTTTDGINGTRGLAASPPIVGSNVRVQEPSVGTRGIHEPRNQFRRSTADPFQQPPMGTPEVHESRNQYPENTAKPLNGPWPHTFHDVATGPTPGPSNISPGDRGPAQQSSRAARTYTPPLHEPPRAARDRSTSSQVSPRPRDVPVDADGPSRAPMQQRSRPEDPRMTAFRNTAYNAPPPSQGTARQPEMQQTNKHNSPFMPSPDIRPPSDDTIQLPQQQRTFVGPNESGPSMPNLSIPSTYVPPTEERRARDRSQSQSRHASGVATPKPTTPVQDLPKKSVSFNPRPEFSDAMPSTTTRDQPVADSDVDTSDVQRRRRHEREQERNRDRDRGRQDRERHDYDAGDDFSDDTPLEDHRRRSHERGDRSDRDRDKDRGTRHSFRRERSDTQSLDRDTGLPRDQGLKRSNTLVGSSSSSRKSRRRDDSPGSDTTIDLPPRFDEKGRRRDEGDTNRDRDRERDPERTPEQDDLAGKLDNILGGLFGRGGSGSPKRR